MLKSIQFRSYGFAVILSQQAKNPLFQEWDPSSCASGWQGISNSSD